MPPYLKSLNLGHSSNTVKTQNRLSKFLNDCEKVSTSNTGGQFAEEVQAFKRNAIQKLRDEGHSVTLVNDKWVMKIRRA